MPQYKEFLTNEMLLEHFDKEKKPTNMTDWQIQDAEIEANISILKKRIEKCKQQLREYQKAVRQRPYNEIVLLNEALDKTKTGDEVQLYVCIECGK